MSAPLDLRFKRPNVHPQVMGRRARVTDINEVMGTPGRPPRPTYSWGRGWVIRNADPSMTVLDEVPIGDQLAEAFEAERTSIHSSTEADRD